jgi:hypothetical protein
MRVLNMREKNVDSYLRKAVKQAGGEVRKVVWTARRGAPDRLVLLPGCHFWVELKKPGGVLAPHQVREIERLRSAGCVVYVCSNEDEINDAIRRANS